MFVYLNGLMLGLSLITALGPQNIFLIRQGTMRNHALLSTVICFVCDLILVVISVTSLHNLLKLHPQIQDIMAWAGAAFLFYYGFTTLRQGIKGTSTAKLIKNDNSRLQIILLSLGFSLLNPHAIIDSFIIIGGGSAQFPDHESAFIMGVATASLIWFTSLSLTTYRFSSVLSRAKIWQSIEIMSGLLMFFLGIKLIISQVI